MRNPVTRVKNFITTHRAPIAFSAGIYVGAYAMHTTKEWETLLTEPKPADATND